MRKRLNNIARHPPHLSFCNNCLQRRACEYTSGISGRPKPCYYRYLLPSIDFAKQRCNNRVFCEITACRTNPAARFSIHLELAYLMHFYARPTFVLINPSISLVGFDVFRNGIAFLASTITYKCISHRFFPLRTRTTRRDVARDDRFDLSRLPLVSLITP